MKQKKITRRLNLGKVTISKLDGQLSNVMKGGTKLCGKFVDDTNTCGTVATITNCDTCNVACTVMSCETCSPTCNDYTCQYSCPGCQTQAFNCTSPLQTCQ